MIAAASAGNALEFYDFFIYGFFALSLANSFFPGHSQTARLLLTYGTFAISFFARPVGALILGAYADAKGRASCMMLAVTMMSAATLMMALLPSYEQVGILAPLGMLVARLLQGFALGGEFGSSTALMIEHSGGAETQAASWQGVSQNLAGLLAAGVAWVLTSQQHFPGNIQPFRVAFALGALGGVGAFLLRRRIGDAPVFLEQQRVRPRMARLPVSGIVVVACMVAIGTAQTYLVLYLPTYAATELGIQTNKALGSVCLLYVFFLLLTPLRLFIAKHFDVTHQTWPMILSCLAMAAMAYPVFALLAVWPGHWGLFCIPFVFAILGLPYNAPLNGFMGLVFPMAERGLGLSTGYALGIAFFGGASPFIFTELISMTGDPRSPGLYLILAAIITLLALLVARWRLLRFQTNQRISL
ncbi:MFS transporter [Acidocella sp.]|uniref:MFS transporter n=1 Tax=Acidocella sp. TaxID=50710 RepID=UPI003CFD3770